MVNNRTRRETRHSSYPTTPGSTTSSLPFQYSIARPPTDFSTNLMYPNSAPLPPLPTGHQLANYTSPPQRPPKSPARFQTNTTGTRSLLVHTEEEEEDEDADNEGDTPLYAQSGYSRTAPARTHRDSVLEYPLTTALPTQDDGRDTPLYARSEWDSQYGPETSVQVTGSQIQGRDSEVSRWEEKDTAWSKSSYAPRGTVLDTVYEENRSSGENGAYEGYYDDIDLDEEKTGAAAEIRDAGYERDSGIGGRSLADLTEKQNPFDEEYINGNIPQHFTNNGEERQIGLEGRKVQAPLLTPEAHQRLGRMSVVPARYTLPPTSHSRDNLSFQDTNTPISDTTNPYAPTGGLRFKQTHTPSPQKKKGVRVIGLGRNLVLPPLTDLRRQSLVSRIKTSRLGQLYLTYRPFITTVHLLIGAMVLTLAMKSGGTLGTFVKVQQGAFGGKVGAGTEGVIGLGVGGWCQVDVIDSYYSPVCKTYKRGDFVSSGHPFQIPGSDSLISTLSNLLAAQTALTWLLATYHLTTAFLHFFLLFGLSIPWNFFDTSDPLPPLTGIPPSSSSPKPQNTVCCPSEDEVIQKEVDLRVRCEKPPYEAYGWVWWAWWAHRRGPVGCIFGLLVGVVGLCTIGISGAFYMQVKGAVEDGKASIAAGTLVPFIALLLSLDPIISASRYLLHARYNFNTFNAPPSPTPAAIFLPHNTKPMRHIRNTGAASYFATAEPDGPSGLSRANTTFHPESHAPPVPLLRTYPTAPTPGAAPLDPETIRWLAAYPLDPDLVSLISSLRQGEESEDFVLSDVGLLYLRPDPEGEGGDALLVPPAGGIRVELLKDAHFEVLDQGDEGGSAHWGPETMLAKMGETFWWPGIDDDCRVLVENCERCRGDGIIRDEGELKLGMTPLPYTGMKSGGYAGEMTAKITNGGESAMAADMAYAMRRAEDDANRLSVRY